MTSVQEIAARTGTPGFENRHAVITGGASGIGAAIARAFAEAGARVTLADRNLEGAQALAASLGPQHGALEMDVAQRASVEAGMAAAGPFDILIANAGVSSMNHALDLTDAEWDSNFDVNARGVFLTNQIAARQFRGRSQGPKGVIVNTASLAAKVGAPLLAHYSASKFAVLGWTQALARELAPEGIRVNAVCPGFVQSAMQAREIDWEARLRGITPEEVRADYIRQTPMGRIETPEDVAGVVLFLCSEAAGFMTGQGVNVTGGVYMG